MKIDCNLDVFAMSAGLVAAGYDMYSTDIVGIDILALTRQISQLPVVDGVRKWFKTARTGQVAVNPYWPRGHHAIMAAYDGTAVERLSGEHRLWLDNYPEMLAYMRLLTEDLNETYISMVEHRKPSWQAALQHSDRVLLSFFGENPSHEVIFVPNLLISPYAADFVHVGDTIAVLGAYPDAESILHEVLHTALLPCRGIITSYAAQHGTKGFAVDIAMKKQGYMPDDSLESRIGVIEECIVRAMSVVLAESSFDKMAARLATHVVAGFTGVALAGAIFIETSPKAHEIHDFVAHILERI